MSHASHTQDHYCCRSRARHKGSPCLSQPSVASARKDKNGYPKSHIRMQGEVSYFGPFTVVRSFFVATNA